MGRRRRGRRLLREYSRFDKGSLRRLCGQLQKRIKKGESLEFEGGALVKETYCSAKSRLICEKGEKRGQLEGSYAALLLNQNRPSAFHLEKGGGGDFSVWLASATGEGGVRGDAQRNMIGNGDSGKAGGRKGVV